MEVGTGGDMATQSPSSVVMVLADAPPEPSAKSSPSRDTTAAAQVAQESKQIDAAAEAGGLCVAEKGDVNVNANAAAPLPPRPTLHVDAPSTPKTPQTPVSSMQYAGDSAEHDIAEEQQDEDEDDDGDSSSSEEDDDEAEYERTPTGAS